MWNKRTMADALTVVRTSSSAVTPVIVANKAAREMMLIVPGLVSCMMVSFFLHSKQDNELSNEQERE
jgi:hypothetical protein